MKNSKEKRKKVIIKEIYAKEKVFEKQKTRKRLFSLSFVISDVAPCPPEITKTHINAIKNVYLITEKL